MKYYDDLFWNDHICNKLYDAHTATGNSAANVIDTIFADNTNDPFNDEIVQKQVRIEHMMIRRLSQLERRKSGPDAFIGFGPSNYIGDLVMFNLQ